MRTIISLTSYGERIKKTLPNTLRSVSKINGLNPDKIILYITKDDRGLLDEKTLLDFPNLKTRVTDDKVIQKIHRVDRTRI